METKLVRLEKGLNLDLPVEYSSEGHHRFALNAIDEHSDGNIGLMGNEASNELVLALKEGFIIIGTCVVSEHEIVLFAVHEVSGISEILLYDTRTREANVEVSDEGIGVPSHRLNFNLEMMVFAVYRVRNSCNRTIYFVDGVNPPRFFVLGDAERFKIGGKFNATTMEITRHSRSISRLRVDVSDGDGKLRPGSYAVAVEYCNESGQGTGWSAMTNGIIIYNDKLTDKYSSIGGSMYSETQTYKSMPETSKAISVEVSRLSKLHTHYRLALICKNSGSGVVNQVLITKPIRITDTRYKFTGGNNESIGQLEDILVDPVKLPSAAIVAQTNDRLILGSIGSEKINYKALQRYASRIDSRCVVVGTAQDDMVVNASKHPLHQLAGGVGYMPGELYCFGIVYVFSDGTESPVMHIPGSVRTDSRGDDSFPMSTDNKMSYRYNYSDEDYWGVNANGDKLTDSTVRHHRFPRRSELGVDHVDINYGDPIRNVRELLNVSITREDNSKPVEVRVVIDGTMYSTGLIEDYEVTIRLSDKTTDITSFVDSYSVYMVDEEQDGKLVDITNDLPRAGITNVSVDVRDEAYLDDSGRDVSVTANLLGIRFYDIEKPCTAEIGKSVMGYYIVRLDRDESEASVIEQVMIFPNTTEAKYTSSGLLNPEESKLSRDSFSIVSLRNKLQGKRLPHSYSIEVTGEFVSSAKTYGRYSQLDVKDGTSYNKEYHLDKDDDGWDLNVYSRESFLAHRGLQNPFRIDSSEIKSSYHLGALDNAKDDDRVFYNVACDNNIIVCQLNGESDELDGRVFTGYITRPSTGNEYFGYEYKPYKRVVNDLRYFTDGNNETTCFGGDTYVSGINYSNHIFYDNQVANRSFKDVSTWKYLGAGLVFLAGVVGAVFTGGASLYIAAGLLLSSAAASARLISSGIKYDNMVSAWGDDYNKGLREAFSDKWVKYMARLKRFDAVRKDGYIRRYFTDKLNEIILSDKDSSNLQSYVTYLVYIGSGGSDAISAGEDGYYDDTIVWFVDGLANVYLESTVNASLRIEGVGGFPNYMKCPRAIESANNDAWIFEVEKDGKGQDKDFVSSIQRNPRSELEKLSFVKLLEWDNDKSKHFYRGLALSELYEFNEDYLPMSFKGYFMLDSVAMESSECDAGKRRFYWSERSVDEKSADEYLHFKHNNYKSISGSTGVLTNIVPFKNNLLIHSEHSLMIQPLNMQERVDGDFKVYIGTGEFASVPLQDVLGAEATDTIGGLHHQSASINTPLGYFFASLNDRKVYHFDGKVNILSNAGMSKWFNDRLRLNGKRYTPHLTYGSGIVMAYDYRNNRLLLSLRDNGITGSQYFGRHKFTTPTASYYSYKDKGTFRVYYDCDNELSVRGEAIPPSEYLKAGFTMSYSFKRSAWLSYHSYLPNLYVSLSDRVHSVLNDGELYRHDADGYTRFYGKQYPFTLEFAVSSNPMVTTVIDSLSFNTQSDESNIEDRWDTFNVFRFYNSRQASLEHELNPNSSIQGMRMMPTTITKPTLDRNEKDYTLNSFRDDRTHYEGKMFTRNRIISISDIEFAKWPANKSWHQLAPFRDKFLLVRMSYVKENPKRLLFKYLLTNPEVSHR